MSQSFADMSESHVIEVPVTGPSDLPSVDIRLPVRATQLDDSLSLRRKLRNHGMRSLTGLVIVGIWPEMSTNLLMFSNRRQHRVTKFYGSRPPGGG